MTPFLAPRNRAGLRAWETGMFARAEEQAECRGPARPGGRAHLVTIIRVSCEQRGPLSDSVSGSPRDAPRGWSEGLNRHHGRRRRLRRLTLIGMRFVMPGDVPDTPAVVNQLPPCFWMPDAPALSTRSKSGRVVTTTGDRPYQQALGQTPTTRVLSLFESRHVAGHGSFFFLDL